ncbi:hypothetical protein B566_EDAN018002 [Ephemera danica]|nr:hypothetical protein B566_EDAN018002 [Ephemera danica]
MVSTGKKSIRTGFDLASLPPTTTAAKYHMHRVYHQVQEWIGINLPPEEWGWKITEAKKYVPICNTEQPAPEWILQMATCACKTGCKTARCSCRRAGTHCTDMCQVCHGMECSNSVTIEIDDLNR